MIFGYQFTYNSPYYNEGVELYVNCLAMTEKINIEIRPSAQPWQIRLRLALLVLFNCRWNAWVRGFTAWLDKPYVPFHRKRVTYPHMDGDFLVIGPECFGDSRDMTVICYKGENYYTVDVERGGHALYREWQSKQFSVMAADSPPRRWDHLTPVERAYWIQQARVVR